MKKNFLMAAIIVCLTGCIPLIQAAQQRQRDAVAQQAKVDADAAAIQCSNKYTSGEFKTHVEVAYCLNTASTTAFQRMNFPYMDLVNLHNAKRIEVAEREDMKKITPAQAELELAEFQSYLTTEIQRRNGQSVNTQLAISRETTQQNIAQQQLNLQQQQLAQQERYMQQQQQNAAMSNLRSSMPTITNCNSTVTGVTCYQNH